MAISRFLTMARIVPDAARVTVKNRRQPGLHPHAAG